MRARNRVEIGMSHATARLHSLAESVPWNRFLGFLKVKKFGLWLWGKNQFLVLSRNQIRNRIGHVHKMLIVELVSTFHPLDALINTSSFPRGREYTCFFLNSSSPPPPRCDNKIYFSQGIDFMESMPGTLKSSKTLRGGGGVRATYRSHRRVGDQTNAKKSSLLYYC